MLSTEWQGTYEIKEAARAASRGIRWPRRRTIIIFILLILAVSLAVGAFWEMRTSRIQARVLSGMASKLTFQLGAGPSDSIHFPRAGPLDERLGYVNIQDFTNRLKDKGYGIDSQARSSPELLSLTRKNIPIPYYGTRIE